MEHSEMLSYTEFVPNLKLSDIQASIKIILDGFNPDLEFTSETMDFILSKDYVSDCYKKKYKNKCSIDGCIRLSRRNNMCKNHNLELNYSEKCCNKKCKNMKEMDGSGKKNKHCYRHKIRKFRKNNLIST